jgi:hypothetical protein
MTIQVILAGDGKSKKVLQDKLNTNIVFLHDPSIFEGSRGSFSSAMITIGESFPVVMDHPKRTRFATITRKADGSFSVK